MPKRSPKRIAAAPHSESNSKLSPTKRTPAVYGWNDLPAGLEAQCEQGPSHQASVAERLTRARKTSLWLLDHTTALVKLAHDPTAALADRDVILPILANFVDALDDFNQEVAGETRTQLAAARATPAPWGGQVYGSTAMAPAAASASRSSRFNNTITLSSFTALSFLFRASPEIIGAMENIDPLTLLDSLSPEQIVSQLEDLDREVRALRVLLRSARARQRRAQHEEQQPGGQERGRAD